MLTERFVAIDRDGVINEDSDDYIKSAAEWMPIPGSIEGIAKLSQAGYRIAIISNQSGLGRGLFDIAALNAIHNKLRDLLLVAGGRIEMILFCPHGPSDGCGCRKPESGLFNQLAVRLGFPLQGLPFVGDSVTDIGAGRGAGMEPILVRSGKGERTLVDHPQLLGEIRVFRNLKDFADFAVSSGESM
jgi:D-glycero-D-manno-heptose 1,7-bisphosphate phosphatase